MSKTFRKQVNRKAVDYHAQRISEMNDLDKAASYLLAISYSSRTSPTKVSQGLIQMDCVAVAVIKGEWLVASRYPQACGLGTWKRWQRRSARL